MAIRNRYELAIMHAARRRTRERRASAAAVGLAAIATLSVALASAQTPPLTPAPAVEPPPPSTEPAPESTAATPPADAPAAPAAIVESMPPAPVIEKLEQAAPATEAESTLLEEDTPAWNEIVKLSGYVEAYYSWNFNQPDNDITANRWLDEKVKTFTLQTLALDVAAQYKGLSGQVTLMFGPTADRWYFEDAAIKAGERDVSLGFGAYSNETWKHIQNAWAGYEIPIGAGLNVQGGLMPTQVGYEVAAVKDNWNFSRSNLFNFLPFFHVGVRASYPVTESLTLSAAVYNGWNQTSDVSKGKTFSLGMAYAVDRFALSLLYLGGNERREGDAAGEPWRNLFDLVTQVQAHERLTFGANLDAGFEANELGTDAWFAAALYARVKAVDWLYFAVRGDGIYEKVPSEMGTISPILLGGADHIISGTFTAEVRPLEGISFRLEYRHDGSDEDVPLFYKEGRDVSADGTTTTPRLASSQDTLTLGMAGWF